MWIIADLLTTLRQAGFQGEGLRTMAAIIQAESGGNPRAFNPRSRDLSYGLAQINMRGPLGPDRRRRFGLARNEDLFDPATNARVAFEISGGGKNFKPWTTFTSGKYKQHLAQFPGEPRAIAAAKPQKPAAAAPTSPPVGAQPRFMLPQLNRLAREFGFKSFAQAFGIPNRQMRDILKASVPAVRPSEKNPNRIVFVAKPTDRKTSSTAAKGSGKGVVEMFYDPAGRGGSWDSGHWVNPIGNHDDHVHLSFDDPETTIFMINAARDMGLRVGENPYVDPVEPEVHVTGSFHMQNFPGRYNGKILGRAIDVSGSSELMMRFYTLARRYVS